MANESITLDLSLDEVNIVLNALGELPAKASMAVISKIQSQAQPQVTPEPIPEGAEQPLFYPPFSSAVTLADSSCTALMSGYINIS